MGIFRHPLHIAATREGPFQEFQAVVDTGSIYNWLPASILSRLGVSPVGKQRFKTADGRLIERHIGEVVVRLDGQTRVRLVVFGDEGTEPILGADTLEGFSLAVDPVERRLFPVPGRV